MADHDPIPAAPKGDVLEHVPPGGQRATRALPHSDRAPALARAFVSGQLEAWGLGHLIEVASLLVSELVTNAVVHARTDSAMSIEQHGDTVTVAVQDGGAGGTVAQRRTTPGGPGGGRGLFIVDQLASRWGVDTTSRGSRVWFELPVTPADRHDRRNDPRQR